MKAGNRKPEQSQMLINALMVYADGALKTHAGFNPIGAVLDRSGGTTLLHEYARREEMPAQLVTELLTAALRDHVAGGQLAAAALASMVLFGKRGSDERATAVQVHVEQSDGYCADIFMPYRIRGGMFRRRSDKVRLRFGQPVAQESTQQFWKGLERETPHADETQS